MDYDFSKVAEMAQKVVNGSSSSEKGSYKYQLVYPGEGKIKFRLLFNPKSGLIIRSYNRHKIGGKPIPCAKSYGQECPICKALEDVKNATGIDPKGGKQFRAVFFAQYVSSTYKLGSDDNHVKSGDIIIIMVPWSVNKEIQKTIDEISGNAVAMTELFSSPSISTTFEIERDKDNKYTFKASFPAVPYKSAETQDEFDALLDSIDSLYDVCQASEYTDEVKKEIDAAADSIISQYITPKVVETPSSHSEVPATSISEMATPAVAPPVQHTAPATPTASTAPEGTPSCYGKHAYYADPANTAPEAPIIRGMCNYCPHVVTCSEVK